MKKLILTVLAVSSVVFSSALMKADAASSAWQSDSATTALLSGLDIMVGDDYGNFNLDSYVTRAEMSKIAIASSSYKNTVALSLPFSPFSDVKGTYWGAPYIRAAVSAGIVNGYMDGTFRPDGMVTYEEAITMMLRVLGYTAEDFGASYPYGQVGMAENLKMTEGVNSTISQPLTRRQVAILVCNSLDTAQKNSSADLISVHGCSFVDDVTIIADRDEDSTLASDEISTTSGKYRIRDGFSKLYIGCKGDMVIKDGKYFVAFSPDSEIFSEKYVVYSILNDSLLCYAEGDNTTIKQIKIDGNTTCYKNSTAQTYGNLYSQMKIGDSIHIRYKDNGEIDYINYSEGKLEGPVKVVSSDWKNSFATDYYTKIIRGGKQVEEAEIQLNDIIYYSKNLNMIIAYNEKVSGIYQNASPSKDLPQSITVSGANYEIEGVEIFNDLTVNREVEIGDVVTLLLGRDGKKVAGILTSDKLELDKYVIYSTLNDAILCYNEGDNNTIKQLKIDANTTCYKDTTVQTYGNLYSQMQMGDSIHIRYKDDGEIDYINYIEGTLEGPAKVVSSDWKNKFGINALTKIIRGGKQVSDSDIQSNDIIYYSDSLNMVFAYNEKVSGIYQNASPSKDLPQSITVSGANYEVEGVEAFNDLTINREVEIGDTITLLLGRDGKKVAGVMTSDKLELDKYVIYSTLNDAILCYAEGDNTTIKQLRIDSNTTCYKNSTAQTYGNLYTQMEMGDSIQIRYKDNGDIDYINYSEGKLEGPVKVASSDWKNSFETNSSTKIVRDGKQVADSSIQVNDIIYYSNGLNMILAYTNKVTGVYEAASPSKDLPQTITVSGTDYEVEGVEAFNDLSSSGSVNIGDTVTLLFGRDGKKVAGVVTNTASASGSVVGYITGAGTKSFKNADGTSYSSYYIDLVTSDGTTYTYPTSVNKSNAVKSVAKVSITNGKATVGTLGNITLSGTVNYSKKKIGTKSVADDIKIIDVLEGNTAQVAAYAKTYMQRIDGITLNSSAVKYYATNEKGEITELILNNVTGDAYSYGIVTKGHDKVKGGATIESGGNSYSVANSSMSYGCGVKLAIDGMNAVNSFAMRSYSIGKGKLTMTEAYSGNNVYRLSDKVVVYYKNSSGIMQMSLNEAINGNYRYTCYYDNTEEKGGRIRVIVAEDVK